MGRKSFFGRMGIVMSLLVLFALFGQVSAVDFSADMTDTQGDNVKKSKLFVRGGNYSLDVDESGEKLLIIVDTQNKQTVIVVYSDKEFRVIPSDDMMSVMNDPFQGYIYMAGMGEEKSAGAETVNGYECDKFIIIMQDTEVMTKWVAKKLNFPIKIVAHGNPEKVMELSNITEGPVKESRFKIPEGFTKWIDPETLPVEIPAWASGIEAAPVMVPPFEYEMNAGDIIRVKAVSGKSLKIKAVNKGEAEAKAKVIPFKDGRPLKKESWYNNFAQKGTICARQHETPAVVDEFVVYIYEGSITTISKWQEMVEKDIAAGEEFRYKVEGWDNIETYMVNISDGESVAVYNYHEAGTPMLDNESSPVKWRTTTLKEPFDIKKTALVAKGEEVVVKVEKGKMQIKMGQYDSFEF